MFYNVEASVFHRTLGLIRDVKSHACEALPPKKNPFFISMEEKNTLLQMNIKKHCHVTEKNLFSEDETVGPENQFGLELLH